MLQNAPDTWFGKCPYFCHCGRYCLPKVKMKTKSLALESARNAEFLVAQTQHFNILKKTQLCACTICSCLYTVYTCCMGARINIYCIMPAHIGWSQHVLYSEVPLYTGTHSMTTKLVSSSSLESELLLLSLLLLLDSNPPIRCRPRLG